MKHMTCTDQSLAQLNDHCHSALLSYLPAAVSTAEAH